MRKKIFIVGFLVLILFLSGCGSPREGRACFRENCFKVELAETPEQRTRGLMFRESLDADVGMLFILEEERSYSIWMKNMLFPLDMVWMDKDGMVVEITRNVQPCSRVPCESINSERDVKYVLELNAGTADKIGLSAGDKAVLEIPS